MGLPLFIEMTQAPPPGVSKRAFREMSREGHRKAGRHWHRKMLKDKFKAGAIEKYGLPDRDPRYEKKKRALARRGIVKKRGAAPFVFTGQMQDLLLRKQIVKAFPTRASITMPGPRYVRMRPFKSNHHALGEEVITTTDEERNTLAEIYEKTITELMAKRPKKTHKTR